MNLKKLKEKAKYVLEKAKSAGWTIAKSAMNGAWAAIILLITQATGTTGCTTVVLPDNESGGTVSINGALPIGVQLNSKSNK